MHEEALAAGIDHKYTGGWEFFVGGGVAAFDCNGDRRPDLFIAGGTSPAELYRNESPTGGALKFAKVDLDLPPEDLKNVTGAYPLDIDNDGLMDLVVLRLGRNLILKGMPDCRVRGRQPGLRLRRRQGLDDGLLGDLGEGPDLPDARHRQLRRPHGAGRALGHMRRQLPRPSGLARQAGLQRPRCAVAELLLAVHAVHRLEPVGRAVAAGDQRPPVLPRRRGADVARRCRQAAAPLHCVGGLAARVDLRHGHRPGQPLRQRLSGLCADLDGRHQAAAALRGSRHRSPGLQGHRLSHGRHRGAALYGRRRAALDRLAQPVRRFQQ